MFLVSPTPTLNLVKATESSAPPYGTRYHFCLWYTSMYVGLCLWKYELILGAAQKHCTEAIV